MATLEKPKQTQNQRYEIPKSEYIWDAPYLEKTQIFPSFVRNNYINQIKIFRKLLLIIRHFKCRKISQENI